MSYPEPRYRGEKGEISANFRPATQKPELTIGSGTMVRYLAIGASTHGQFGLYRWDAKPHTPGPSAHFHRTMSESFFIVSGTVRLFNGEHWINATAGDFLYVPEGGVHAFQNESDESASMLLLFAPGANNSSMDADSSDSFWKACTPPSGTYRKSPAVALIQCSPLKSRTVPDTIKNDSDIVLWKCALGPGVCGFASHLYKPNCPCVDAPIAR